MHNAGDSDMGGLEPILTCRPASNRHCERSTTFQLEYCLTKPQCYVPVLRMT